MKILIPMFCFGRQGGFRVLSKIANAWINLGHDCVFLVPSSAQDPYYPTIAKIVFANRSGVVLGGDDGYIDSPSNNFLSIFSGLQDIGKDFDVILANHSHTAWPVFFANCGMAKKFYYIQAYEPDFYPIRTKFKAHILARLSYVLPLKQIANASIYKGFGMAPLDIIPPGIDISIFRKKGGFFSIANKPEIIIGTIGRSEPYKGTHTAVSAYRKLRASDPRLRLKVAFGNVAHADDIEIVAIKNDEELAEFYRSLDVLLVACSTQHGAPHYPVIEAMASGVPVVHTNYYPGDSGNSWIAKDSSTDAVADALREFLNSSELDIADKTERARLTIEKELGWDAVGRRFLLNFARRN